MAEQKTGTAPRLFVERRNRETGFGLDDVVEERAVWVPAGEEPPEGARPAAEGAKAHGWRTIATGGAENVWSVGAPLAPEGE